MGGAGWVTSEVESVGSAVVVVVVGSLVVAVVVVSEVTAGLEAVELEESADVEEGSAFVVVMVVVVVLVVEVVVVVVLSVGSEVETALVGGETGTVVEDGTAEVGRVSDSFVSFLFVGRAFPRPVLLLLFSDAGTGHGCGFSFCGVCSFVSCFPFAFPVALVSFAGAGAVGFTVRFGLVSFAVGFAVGFGSFVAGCGFATVSGFAVFCGGVGGAVNLSVSVNLWPACRTKVRSEISKIRQSQERNLIPMHLKISRFSTHPEGGCETSPSRRLLPPPLLPSTVGSSDSSRHSPAVCSIAPAHDQQRS